MHKNRGVKMRQLDDGIGGTLVLALKALGDGRSRYQVTSTRPRHRRRCHRCRPARSPDRRPIAIWKQTRAHFIPQCPIQRYRRYHRPIDSARHLGCNGPIAADSVDERCLGKRARPHRSPVRRKTMSIIDKALEANRNYARSYDPTLGRRPTPKSQL